ncbi:MULTISPECIES: hypothetical protein [unclassified Curtobacterium]|uniref:hypothetical protein n=1 Tax=unclassified Curtobacterium TaxID=257496 RepID=UPI0011D2964F|nr:MULTISPECIES: hypothetical protein [unclassified Curtobacterium]
MQRSRGVVAVVGVAVVALYAALLVVVQLVLDPLAAVPGRSLGSIYAELERQGFHTGVDVAVVVGVGVVGVLLAAGLQWVLSEQRAPLFAMVAAHLGVLAAGIAPAWMSGTALGMDVADAFMVDGGYHTAWFTVLVGASGAALVAMPFVLVVGQAVHVRRTAHRTSAV